MGHPRYHRRLHGLHRPGPGGLPEHLRAYNQAAGADTHADTIGANCHLVDADAHSNTGTHVKLNARAYIDAYSDGDARAYGHGNARADAYTRAHPGSLAHIDADPHADADSHPRAGADADTHTDYHADTNPDGNSYSHAYSDADPHPDAHPRLQVNRQQRPGRAGIQQRAGVIWRCVR